MTRERLRAYRKSLFEEQELKWRLEEMETRMYSPKSQKLTGMPPGGGSGGSALEEAVTAHQQLYDFYLSKLTGLTTERFEIEKALEMLDPQQRCLIRYRYLDGYSWEGVCEAMHYGWSQTHAIHAAALKALEAAEN